MAWGGGEMMWRGQVEWYGMLYGDILSDIGWSGTGSFMERSMELGQIVGTMYVLSH